MNEIAVKSILIHEFKDIQNRLVFFTVVFLREIQIVGVVPLRASAMLHFSRLHAIVFRQGIVILIVEDPLLQAVYDKKRTYIAIIDVF